MTLNKRYVVFLALIPFGRLGSQTCDSRRTQVGDSTIDLAPPRGFIEVCARDAGLCNLLTAGYPPSVKTIAYFAAAADWDAFRKDSAMGFNHYLIAQLAVSLTPEQLPGFKTYLRSRQGSIPDHSELPRALAAEGRVSLGVFGETPSSISFGTVMTARPRTGPSSDPIVLVATNTAAVVKNHVLSLYVYQTYHGEADVDTAKAVTVTWLQCIQRSN